MKNKDEEHPEKMHSRLWTGQDKQHKLDGGDYKGELFFLAVLVVPKGAKFFFLNFSTCV